MCRDSISASPCRRAKCRPFSRESQNAWSPRTTSRQARLRSLGPEVGRGLGGKHAPGRDGADAEDEAEREQNRLPRGERGEHEGHLEGPFAQGPGGERGDRNGKQRRGKAEHAELEQLCADDARPRSAKRL